MNFVNYDRKLTFMDTIVFVKTLSFLGATLLHL